MSEFRFAQIQWLHAVWAVTALAAALIVLELRGRSLLDRLLSSRMQARLVYRTSLFRRLSAISLITASLVALVIAMMRPQWGMTVQPMSRVDSQIMICLDVSKSMLAEDAVPNRLERAKAELESLLGLLDDGQQVGLTAFAGRAAVLCPLTTDFGFLRLVLAEAGPASVGLGGTKIGEAIRKAVDGFRDAGDVNRLILLITDGEDHDSFPLDAAKVARERGIRIVSIGFGDEAGSKIQITDPESGARTYVKDRNGQDVISRLDGETLREIALETEGAYIPAGTGALDLESIYRAHIRTLLQGTTDAEQRIIRNEAYQWCVVAALTLLIAGLATAHPFSFKTKSLAAGEHRAGVTAAVVMLLSVSFPPASPAAFPAVTFGQADKPSAAAPENSDSDASQSAPLSESDNNGDQDELSPRQLYNAAIAYVQNDPDRAERLLNRARRDAGVDGELRFRTLYNLGWVEVSRADSLVDEDPQQALLHLEQAANRFREAIRVRPDSNDARHNLEIVSRRILELTDALAKHDERDLETRLDELIAQQRVHQSALKDMVVRTDRNPANANDYRREFRQLGVTQRQIISEMQLFVEDARQQADSLRQKNDDEQTAEDRVRAAQLTGMLRYVDLSLQRMNKARSLTRRMQADRAFVRWSAAMTDAKRGRDQLRSPIEVLSVIIGDATELASLTGAMANTDAEDPPDQSPAAAPAWLTKEYLYESQLSTTERTSELTAILAAGVAEQDGNETPEDPQTRRLVEDIKQALPSLRTAERTFGDAGKRIDEEKFNLALNDQSAALNALRDAAEYFYDIRRLIEVVYATELAVRQATVAVENNPDAAAAIIETGQKLHRKNNDRLSRLDGMFDFELSQLEQPAPATQTSPQGQDNDGEEQRFAAAKQILAEAVSHADTVEQRLQEIDPEEPDTSAAIEQLDAELEKLAELRRLFFSLVEHLRETAQRQAELSDNTGEISGKPDQQTPEKVGPLHQRQRQLQSTAEQIADALQTQAEQATAASSQQPEADAARTADAFAKAATLVDQAENAMKKAADGLEPTAGDDEFQVDFDAVGLNQQAALEKLIEALSLLDDSPPQDQNNPQQDQNDQQQQQQDQNQRQQNDQQQELNANQLLQLIRDREAERRRDRQRANVSAGGAVDKDW